ncbi:hypothetical protein L1987_57618 [Smallanthus sonchifolius]|uniref:Uncharacterized protein n=1 Tax=Smallanthus sonchifolius TaxID=185202 RepID=A0ACB9DDM5_9ASTR|nr:hypothetical protein L1987_57618 [Smallanthus sonchifolius]
MAEIDINHLDDKFSPYHNLMAYLIKGKKSEGFNDMIDFLCRSKIHHAITVNPTIYIPHMEDFYNSAWKSERVHNRKGTDGPSMEVSMPHTSTMHIPEEKWMASSELCTCLCCSWVTVQQSQLILIPHPEQQYASTVRTPVHTTKNEQAHKLLTPVLDVIVQLEQRATVAAKYTRKRSKKTHSLLVSKAQSQPKSPHSESQNSDENIKRDSHIIRETSLEAFLLGSGSHPGSIEQPTEPFHYFSSLNLRAEVPCQDDIPSQTTTILEVLIDLAASAPNPSSSPKKVHSGSTDRVNVERVVTTPEARPKTPSSSKDSTTVDEDSLKVKNMELTARVAMLEVEVSKIRHQVSMHEAHQCPTVPTPSLVSVLTNTSHHEDTPPSVNILPEAAAIISLTTAPNFTLTVHKLDFDSILAWGYDGQHERFWIGKEFSGVEELNWDALNPLQVLELYLSSCTNTSSDLSAKLAICRFHDLMEENLPWFEALLEEANSVAYPKDRAESSTAAAQRLAPSRLDLIRSSTLTDEETVCWRNFIHNEMVRGLAVLGWSGTRALWLHLLSE